jgi:hypothetical protein
MRRARSGRARLLLVPVALSALAGRCNVSPPDAEQGDGAPTGAAGAGTDGGSSGPPDAASMGPPPFSCGGVVCQLGSSGVQSFPCCTDDTGECGLRVVISQKCLARHLRGGADSRCAPFEIPGQLTLPGCCSPSGCGALATFDQIGCIPNADVGRPSVDCTPDVPF